MKARVQSIRCLHAAHGRAGMKECFTDNRLKSSFHSAKYMAFTAATNRRNIKSATNLVMILSILLAPFAYMQRWHNTVDPNNAPGHTGWAGKPSPEIPGSGYM